MTLIADDTSETEVELPIRAMAEARLVLTEDLIRAALRREKAALKDAKRPAGRRAGADRKTSPDVASGTKSNELKAVARGAASKPLGPDEGDTHGR
jgi:ribosome maturation factor RimP